MPSINTLERIPEGDELVAVENENVWLAAARNSEGSKKRSGATLWQPTKKIKETDPLTA